MGRGPKENPLSGIQPRRAK